MKKLAKKTLKVVNKGNQNKDNTEKKKLSKNAKKRE
jgi:hypothetical protein